MYIRKASTTFKCASCKGPILKDEPCISTGSKEAHGPSICMRCLRKALTIIKESGEWKDRGWHFLAKILYREQRCGICENIIPIGHYAWISKYHQMMLHRGKPVPLENTIKDFMCSRCIEEFVSNIPEQLFEDSDVKVLERLIKKL